MFIGGRGFKIREDNIRNLRTIIDNPEENIWKNPKSNWKIFSKKIQKNLNSEKFLRNPKSI